MRPRTPELLRSAIESGAYAEAERLLAIYRDEMQAMWEAAGSVALRESVAAEVHHLLAWARSTTLAGRSHMQNKLICISRHASYAGVLRHPDQLELDA